MNNRVLLKSLPGIATADGDGVKLTRIIGSPQLNILDPFLLLDCFESDDAQDYIGGFPTHPHRGFETVTYLLNGRMRHKDNAGHEGVIESGGVQWMTAGKGIMHSEMPEQDEGLLKGFQLWVNLPASAKMSEPVYQEFPPEATALERRDNGIEIRVIAGETSEGTRGPVVNEYTYPTYMDITLPVGTVIEQALPVGHNAFVYVIDGEISVLDNANVPSKTLSAKALGVLDKGVLDKSVLAQGALDQSDQVSLKSGSQGARVLLIAGKPLNEPVARGGPFVMNTKAEIMQAYEDFNSGKF